MSTNLIDPNASEQEDRTASLVEAMKSGQNISETIGDTGSVVTPEDLNQEVIGGNAVDSLFGEGEPETRDGAEDSEDSRQNQEGLADADTESTGDIEEILVKGADGKRKKIKVDFGNRDQIIKTAKLAAGARKWQAERDRALAELESMKGYEEKVTSFDRLSEAFEMGGPMEVLSEMLGADEAQAWISQQFEKAQFRQNASEDELRYLDAQDLSERQARELDLLKKRQEDYENRVSAEREAAEVAEVQSLINPVFDKYRFAGKLGDASQEHDLDELVWTRATKQLRDYEDQGGAITRDAVERAFRSSANKLRKYINGEVSKGTERKVKASKAKALETAQKTAKRGVRNNKAAADARELVNKGDISGFFKNFGGKINF